MLEAFYRVGTTGVPSPADRGSTVRWWWDHIAAQARTLADVGFTAVWLPPALKGGSGTLSVGYDVYDDYDLGAKDQRGTVATRYGTREQLARCVATLRACGLDVYVDLVENQRAGGTNFRYRYRDAARGDGGRFPKDPDNFHPNVPQDPGVFGSPRAREMTFGDDLAIINGRPPGHVSRNLIEAAAWMTRALDVQGYRIDDAKGISTLFVPQLLGAAPIAGKFAVGEFFDGSIDLVRTWIAAVQRRSAAFDFPLKFTLGNMCDRSAWFDMGALDHAGLAGVDPLLAVTFVDDHDTDASPGMAVVSNKALAYAYILTSEGYPCVFYKDYSTDPGCYALKPFIDNLIWIHEKLAQGPTVQRWKEVGLFAYERLGGPHLLVALNKDVWQSRIITVDTGFGPRDHLHDYSGHARDVTTDGAGRASITVPQNHGGLGYVCFSRSGLDAPFAPPEHAVTQVIEGAPDLDVPPVRADAPTVAGRIWVERQRRISLALERLDTSHFTAGSLLEVLIEGPDRAPLAKGVFTNAGGAPVHALATSRGWHRLVLTARLLPPQHPAVSFALTVTYTAPRTGPGAGE